MQEGRVRVAVAEPDVLDISVLLGQVMSVEHVGANSPFPLRLQGSVVVHCHPNSVLYGRVRIVGLREGEVVVVT